MSRSRKAASMWPGSDKTRAKGRPLPQNHRNWYISSTEKYIFGRSVGGPMAAASEPVQEHVPRDLLLPSPLVLGATTTADPFERMIPDIHHCHAIFWSTHVYPGAGPPCVL